MQGVLWEMKTPRFLRLKRFWFLLLYLSWVISPFHLLLGYLCYRGLVRYRAGLYDPSPEEIRDMVAEWEASRRARQAASPPAPKSWLTLGPAEREALRVLLWRGLETPVTDCRKYVDKH